AHGGRVLGTVADDHAGAAVEGDDVTRPGRGAADGVARGARGDVDRGGVDAGEGVGQGGAARLVGADEVALDQVAGAARPDQHHAFDVGGDDVGGGSRGAANGGGGGGGQGDAGAVVAELG